FTPPRPPPFAPSLHDALPISVTLAQMGPPPDLLRNHESGLSGQQRRCSPEGVIVASDIQVQIRKTQDEEQLTGADLDRFLEHGRSEEHTSELQSRGHLVCRLP